MCTPLPTLCTGPVVPTQRGVVLSCLVGEEPGHRGQCLTHGHREGVEAPGCKAGLSPQAMLRNEDLTDQAKVVVISVCFSVGEGTAAGGQWEMAAGAEPAALLGTCLKCTLRAHPRPADQNLV